MIDPFESQKTQLIHDLKTVVSEMQSMVNAESPGDPREAIARKQSVSEQLSKALDRLHRLEIHASAKVTPGAGGAGVYLRYAAAPRR
jgi:hypothetical protein